MMMKITISISGSLRIISLCVIWPHFLLSYFSYIYVVSIRNKLYNKELIIISIRGNISTMYLQKWRYSYQP